MRSRRLHRVTRAGRAAIAATVASLGAGGCAPGPRQLAAVLNLRAPPRSLRVVACAEWGVTDALMTCSVEVAPEEFPALLRGYAFEAAPVKATSHAVGGGPRVGPVFDVVRAYTAHPAEFKRGGHVQVFADAAGRRAIVDLYEE